MFADSSTPYAKGQVWVYCQVKKKKGKLINNNCAQLLFIIRKANSLAMTNCSILKPVLLNLMEFHWNLMECYHLLNIHIKCLCSHQKPPFSSKLIWLISLLDVKTQIFQVITSKAIYIKLFVTPAKCIVPHNLLVMKDLSC